MGRGYDLNGIEITPRERHTMHIIIDLIDADTLPTRAARTPHGNTVSASAIYHASDAHDWRKQVQRDLDALDEVGLISRAKGVADSPGELPDSDEIVPVEPRPLCEDIALDLDEYRRAVAPDDPDDIDSALAAIDRLTERINDLEAELESVSAERNGLRGYCEQLADTVDDLEARIAELED